MSENIKDREIQRKREYHRNWRKNHPESVKAAQVRYWAKKAEEMRAAQMEILSTDIQEDAEIR